MRILQSRPVLFAILAIALGVTGCPAPEPQLKVTPDVIDFGRHATEQTFTISYAGTGSMGYFISISTADDAHWLSVDKTTGTLQTEPERVTLRANRSLLAARPQNPYQASVSVRTGTGTRTLNVYLTMPGTPILDDDGTGPIFFADFVTEQLFRISNTGDESLTWTIEMLDPDDPDDPGAPVPVTASPSSGSVPPSGSATVTLTVDRTGLEVGVHQYTLRLMTNAGEQEYPVTVSVGASPEIGASPRLLSFGTDTSELGFNVYNTGPQGSRLEFSLRTDRDDVLAVSPASGVSIGAIADVGGPIVIEDLDNVPVSVVLDRGAMGSRPFSGTVYIEAPGLEPVEIAVTATPAPLTIEGATNRSRPPFLVRFVFLLRDSTGEAIDTTDPSIREAIDFRISEDGHPLDLDETSVFVDGPEGLKYSMVLLLDYTGSMYNANVPQGGSVLIGADEREPGEVIGIMEEAAKHFVWSLPDGYQLALMAYHDRHQYNRLLQNFTTQTQGTDNPLANAIDDFQLAEVEHGATELYDALYEAIDRLRGLDASDMWGENDVGFDDADMRSVVFVTDGRDTSSQKTADDVVSFAEEHRVRLYPIGFGQNVNRAVLLNMASATGGHYYPAGNDPERLFVLLGDGAGPGRIATELQRQIVLTYLALSHGEHAYSVAAQYQGQSAQFERDAIVWNGDTRAGQVTMRTSGIVEGTAEVYVRGEYMPRNTTFLRVRFVLPPGIPVPTAADVELIGLFEDWLLVDEGDGIFSVFTEPDIAPGLPGHIPIGSWGNLMKVTLTGLDPAAMTEMGIRVDNTVYFNQPIFFHYPGDLWNPDAALALDDAPARARLTNVLSLETDFDPQSYSWDADGDGILDFYDATPNPAK